MQNIFKSTIEKITGKTTYYVVNAGRIEKKNTSFEDRDFYKKFYGEVFDTFEEANDYKEFIDCLQYL